MVKVLVKMNKGQEIDEKMLEEITKMHDPRMKIHRRGSKSGRGLLTRTASDRSGVIRSRSDEPEDSSTSSTGSSSDSPNKVPAPTTTRRPRERRRSSVKRCKSLSRILRGKKGESDTDDKTSADNKTSIGDLSAFLQTNMKVTRGAKSVTGTESISSRSIEIPQTPSQLQRQNAERQLTPPTYKQKLSSACTMPLTPGRLTMQKPPKELKSIDDVFSAYDKIMNDFEGSQADFTGWQ